MKSIYLYIALLFVWSCNDPSLDNNNELEETVETVFNKVQLSNITTQNTSGAVTQTIDFTYNDQNLVASVAILGTNQKSIVFEYAENNGLLRFNTIENGITVLTTVKIENNTITATTNNANGAKIETVLFIDSQNRINRKTTTRIEMNGNRIPLEDKRIQIDANFNIIRENIFLNNNAISTASVVYEYGFNINPFRDMNDVLRFLIFEDFVPSTRIMPLRITSSNQSGITSEANIQYTINTENFPTMREINTNQNGVSLVQIQLFSYR